MSTTDKPKLWQRKTALEILNTEYPVIEDIAPGIITTGLVGVVAPPKGLKSISMLHLGTACSYGGYFMGSIRVIKCIVLYLALEDGEVRIKTRLIKQGKEANNNFYICTQWKGGTKTLRAYLIEYPETGLVIIDTLFIFSPIQDSNSYTDTYKILSELQTLAKDFNICIIVVHHTRKGSHRNNGEAWADEMMGSNGFYAALDTIIYIQKKDGKNEGIMRVRGRDIEEKCYEIVFDPDLFSWRITGEGSIEKAEPQARAVIIEALEKAGSEGMTNGELAKKLDKSPSAVGNRLKELQGMGRVYKVSYGKYILSQFHEVSHMNNSENVKVDNKESFTLSHTPRDSENVKVQKPAEKELDIY